MRTGTTKAHRKAMSAPAAREFQAVAVLVVDDEEWVREEVAKLLETFRMTTVRVGTTAEALRVAESTKIDVALIDWRLGKQDNGIALGRSLRRDHGIPFVLFSGYLDIDSTGHAYRAGASDVIAKPIRPGRLLAAVRLALGRRGSSSRYPPAHRGADSISKRWARMALRACHTEDDPKNEPDVAEAGGVSTSVYRRDCYECDVEPIDTRDLIRLLRANALAQRDRSTLRSHLGTLDPRTVTRIFERAGLPIDSQFLPLRAFFLTQRLIPTTKECLRELAHLAANDPLFLVEPDKPKTGTGGT